MTEVGPTAVGWSSDGRAGCGSVLGLRIPVDPQNSVSLVALRLTASELSDAIGGGLLEDALVGDVGGWGYTFYVDEWRVAKGLPCNERAAALAVRLGHMNRAWLADLRGDVLVLGCDGRLDDVSVPGCVVEAARSGVRAQQVGAER